MSTRLFIAFGRYCSLAETGDRAHDLYPESDRKRDPDILMRLITPIGLLVTTALLAVLSAAALNVAAIERSPVLLVGALVAAVACAGTAYMQRWSQYLVYVVTTGFMAKWCWSIFDGWRTGYFGFRFDSNLERMQSLLPGLALVVLSAVCSWMVYSHFSRVGGEQSPQGGSP